MTGDALRDRALSDERVIAALNEGFAPVWINTRREPVPDFPDRSEVLYGAALTESGHLIDPFNRNYFMRVVALDPSDLALLNPQSGEIAGSWASMVEEGHFAYAQYSATDVLELLEQVGADWHLRRAAQGFPEQAAR